MEQYIAKLEEQNLNMDQLKDVAKNVGAKNVHNIKTKKTLIEKIAQVADDTDVDMGFLVWVDPTEAEEATEEVQEIEEKVVQTTARSDKYIPIKNHPKQKVIVHALHGEDQQREGIFSVNEYGATIIYGEEVELPIPVIQHIKSLKTKKGFVEGDKVIHREVPRFSIGLA